MAFENSVCPDYITEKFWRTLGWNSVHITLTRDFYTPEVVPPGSFIGVQDFPSVKALAEYLLYLDKNDTAYNEYFTWKKEYALGSRDAACYICDALYNECPKPKFYKDIFKTFWNDDVRCKENERKLLQLIDSEEEWSMHVEYPCSLVWGNCGKTLSNKLQKLQNRAARVTTSWIYDVDVDSLFHKLS